MKINLRVIWLSLCSFFQKVILRPKALIIPPLLGMVRRLALHQDQPLNSSVIFGVSCLLFFSGSNPLQAQQKTVLLATTTSVQDSGLLDVLIPLFEKKAGYFVKTIALGSGLAMAMGRRGEADVLLVHSPEDEKRFVAEGYGIHRRIVMHNDYIIVGPGEDAAKIKRIRSSTEAFKRIAANRSLFLSRGDHSGTHMKEKSIWEATGINPEGRKWYQQTGLGMGQTMNVAAEKKGYTLADRGTYLALRKNLGLDLLVEGDPILLNLYHVIEVNPVKWPKVNASGGRAFADFLVSKEAQTIIKTFGVDKFGSPLFFPGCGPSSPSKG